MLENIHRKLSRRLPEDDLATLIIEGVQDASRPVLFSTVIILVAFIPLFTMQGVPGKIFAPMSVTYGFALIGALLFGLVFAPVLAFVLAPKGPPKAVPTTEDSHAGEGTWLSNFFRRVYNRAFGWTMHSSKLVWGVAFIALAIAGFIFVYGVGGEFMPPLEEGNLWIRATLPQDVSFDLAEKTVDDFRREFMAFPEVKQVVSQLGRPNDGTDVTTFNNLEFLVDLKDSSEWPASVHGDKDKLIEQMQHALSKYPGAVFGFSQQIQDNVEEAMSGVKGENSLKIFGDDLGELSKQALLVQNVMEHVQGVTDVGIFKVDGQPSLIIQVDRAKASRYGVAPADVNAAVQAAVGGAPVTQMVEGDRRFDITVRYPQQYRDNPDAVGSIVLPAADGSNVPLSAIANIGIRQGSFQIYREAGRRYIPIKFSVRGRDLAATITDLQKATQ